MMKIMYSIFACILLFSIQESSYDKFIMQFPKIQYDENNNFLTRSLNSKSPGGMTSEYAHILDSLSLNYLLKHDSTRLSYQYKFYNVDEDRYYVSTEPYKFYAVKSIITPSYDLAIYCYFHLENKFYYLNSYNKQGNAIDTQVINEVIYENVNTDYSYKFTLFFDSGFRVYWYRKNNDNNNSHMNTKVIMSDYKISSLGYFSLVSKDSIYLDQKINNYSKFIHMPEGDDPVRPYWTLN